MTTKPALACLLFLLISVACWPQFMGPGPRLQFPTPASPDEPAVTVAYKDLPLADALKDLCAQTGYLFLAAQEARGEKVTVSATGKPFEILGRLCMQVQCAPRPAIFLVPDARMPKAQPKFDLPDRKVTVELKDMDTKTVLDMVATAAKIRFCPDDDVLKATPKLSVSFNGASVEEVLDNLATQLKCHCARGLYLEKVDPEAEMDRFMNLPVEQQEQMMLQGLQAAKAHLPSQQQVQQGMTDGLKQFWAMSPEERQRIIERVAGRMGQMGDLVSRFSPEGRAQVMQVMRPFLQAGIGVYMRLTPDQQAELAPAIRAMEKFPGAQQ